MKLHATSFRVTNFRNIDDSGSIPLEQVTAFVGRNESGKTALLQALHKFNPATEDRYNPQREFPRDRYTDEYHNNGEEFPVCAVEFEINDEFREELKAMFTDGEPPTKVICTRYYNNSLVCKYDTAIVDDVVPSDDLVIALDSFNKAVRRIKPLDPNQSEEFQKIRAGILNWSEQKRETLSAAESLRSDGGKQLLKQIKAEANSKSQPETAEAVEELVKSIDKINIRATTELLSSRLYNAIVKALPIFIYFENYGILDSAVYLPNFLRDIKQNPSDPRIRTINAMFKHVGLTAEEIERLGREGARDARQQGNQVTEAMISKDRENKELREIKLNSASIAITKRFNEWYGQRRHNLKYQADGDYFRIWVSDDKRPGIEIELESRSKGFQWFFSFYLVFLVESQEGHKDAILLLDEPGIHLHPTAQQELISFFERLSADNPMIYTTHSPFLIDGEHIHRVRPVKEDETGHSQVSVDTWPQDRETIFPLQAAAGYAMVRGLFQHKKNVLVEGMSDYLYLHSLNLLCRALGRQSLPDDIYITPCGGTKNVGYISSLFLGQQVRPVVLLDSDDAGRDRHQALLKELFAGHENVLLLLGNVLGLQECETEDILGESVLIPALNKMLGIHLDLTPKDRENGSIIDQIKATMKRLNMDLPDGWKGELARQIAVAWAISDPNDIPHDVMDRAENLFRTLSERFIDIKP